MTNVILVPGFRGSNGSHWQQNWLNDYSDSVIIEQDDWHYPDLTEWLYALEAKIAENPNAILVGHSLGSVLITHLQGRQSVQNVTAAILVAPADVENMAKRDDRFSSFAPIKRQVLEFPSIVIASQNDPYMSFLKAEALANVWGSGFIDYGKSGHINVESGHTRLEDAYVLADSFVPQKNIMAA